MKTYNGHLQSLAERIEKGYLRARDLKDPSKVDSLELTAEGNTSRYRKPKASTSEGPRV